MAEPTQINSLLTKIAGPLVVTTIIALVGGGFGMWNTVGDLNRDVITLEEWKEEGDRFTKAMGDAETSARISADFHHDKEISDINSDQIRQWSSIREHLGTREHSGAGFRLKSLESDTEELKADVIEMKREIIKILRYHSKFNQLEN